MSHVNANKAVASHIKSVTGAGMTKMMDSSMGNMSLGSMMSQGMGSMMKSPKIATGAVASAGSRAGKSVLKKVFKHPVVLFSLGVVVGCYVYKYRKSIISTSEEV